MGLVITTIISAVISVGIAALLFLGANWLIDSTRRHWALGPAAVGGGIGLIAGVILQNNGILKLGVKPALAPDGSYPVPVLEEGWITIVLGLVIGAAIGYGYGRVRPGTATDADRVDRRWRPIVFVGPAVAFLLMGQVLPAIATVSLSFREGREGNGGFTTDVYTNIFSDPSFFNVNEFDRIFTSRLFIVAVASLIAALAAAFAARERQDSGAEATRGKLIDRGVQLFIAVPIVLMLLGLIEGIVFTPNTANKSLIFDYILTPISQSPISLVIVGVLFFGACIWYLVQNRGVAAEKFATPMVIGGLLVAAAGLVLGLATDAVNNGEMLSMILVGIGVALLWRMLSVDQSANRLDLNAPMSSVLVIAAAMLLALAVFSTLQSVFWNNLWWAATVTGLSTVFGLLLAVLADQARGEKAARTLIFLPMAISMVGAAVIWGFVYQLIPGETQTGLTNAILQALGFEPRGFFINSTMIPWNNFWIMLIMVWIQTGFAMVILSSAIKGVPDDLLEAARVDGANEVQVFWQITIPSIRSTILVVVTTLLIAVMKVFDLVKATTGGANSTNVLANLMFDELSVSNFARSAAFAVIIFILVLPVMINNVKTNLKGIK